MNLRKQKLKKMVGVVLLLSIAVIAVFWLKPYPASPVRVTFLYFTNRAEIGRVGVYAVVNGMNETVNMGHGHYHQASRKGLDAQLGDWGASIISREKKLTAGSTNLVEIWTPTNGGPYQLVLYSVPLSKTTVAFYNSPRVKFASFISRFVHPNFSTQARWYGSVIAESPPFEVGP